MESVFNRLPKLYGHPLPCNVVRQYRILGSEWPVPCGKQDLHDYFDNLADYKVVLLLENVPLNDFNRRDGLARDHGLEILLVPLWPIYLHHFPSLRGAGPWQ